MRLQISWSLIKIASVLKKDENYYPQVILKEYKYTQKEKAIIRYFANDLKYCSDDSDESNKDEIKIKHHNGPFF